MSHDELPLLVQLLREPDRLAELSAGQWDVIVRQARASRVLGRLAHQAAARDLIDQLPGPVQPHMIAENRLTARHERIVKWEVDRIAHALRAVDTPIVLLKGAAYCLLDLPFTKGRLYADTDILVREERLTDVEAALKEHGWEEAEKTDELNKSYFRQWLHELPPMRHVERKTELDVHHTIVPRTDTLQVDPAKLIEASRPVAVHQAGERVRVFAPADMVLHSATHLFRNGDFTAGLRDLFDLHGLVTHFAAAEADFWGRLRERAVALDLTLPCYCGLRYIQTLFGTDVPAEVGKDIYSWAPNALSMAVVDRLVMRSVLPKQVDTADPIRDLAIRALSYWPLPRLRAWLTPLFWKKRLGGGK